MRFGEARRDHLPSRPERVSRRSRRAKNRFRSEELLRKAIGSSNLMKLVLFGRRVPPNEREGQESKVLRLLAGNPLL
jgi:hypothetical protein